MVLRVLVVGNDPIIREAFSKRGWQIAGQNERPERLSLAVFCGNTKIHPSRYGEKDITNGRADNKRDQIEFETLRSLKGVPKIGVGRGAQLLNIAAGGKLWQVANNHTVAHDVVDLLSQSPLRVTSDHSGVMRPSSNGQVIAFSEVSHKFIHDGTDLPPEVEPEVIWYEYEKSICFQPTISTFLGPVDTTKEYFFNLLTHFYGYT